MTDERRTLAAALRIAECLALRYRLRPALEPADIESAAGLAATTALLQWREDGGLPFETYLRRRVYYQLIDDVRRLHGSTRKGSDRPFNASLDASWSEPPADLSADARLDVDTFLDSLPERERWIVECREAGYRSRHIAQRLGLDASRVSQVLAAVRGRWHEYAAA